MIKILKCYPFLLLDPPVEIYEGFKEYVGNLGDKKGEKHKGIDYAREARKGIFISFDVFSAHKGEVFQGENDSWGKYVIVYKQFRDVTFATVYAHLEIVDPKIPFLPPDKRRKRKGPVFPEATYIGKAGASGWADEKIQLHFELLKKDLTVEKPEWEKMDPYGVYDTIDSGRYPQPGHSLRGLNHLWIKDKPPFVNEI